MTESWDPEIDELSGRAYRCMRQLGVYSLNELSTKTEKEVLKVDGVGRKTLNEFREILAKKNLSFRKVVTKPPPPQETRCAACGVVKYFYKLNMCHDCFKLNRILDRTSRKGLFKFLKKIVYLIDMEEN